MQTHNVIANSNIAFGTSGARGLVSDFSNEVCAAFAIAFSQILKGQFTFEYMAIAIDNRPSSFKMAQALSAGLKQCGIETRYYGVLPTPALAYYAMEQGQPCIMVTGSHIPFDRNGLKFYRPDGEITKVDEVAILSCQHEVLPISELPELVCLDAAKTAYIQRYISAFDADCLQGQRIGIYQHSSSGRDLYTEIFTELGADVIEIGRSDEFIPIDTEAVSDEDKRHAKAWVNTYELDALFSTDGDGDRPLVADEQGNWLRGDILGLLCAKLLEIEALAVPVSCNTAIEQCGEFKAVSRCKIGSPYVIEQFAPLHNEFSRIAGFEANGGFLLASELTHLNTPIKPLPTRDAVLPALVLMSQLKTHKLSNLVEQLPARFTGSDRIKNFARENSLALITKLHQGPEAILTTWQITQSVTEIDETDGLRMLLENGDIVHLRPSGNAPELRCYAESDSQQRADELVHHVLSQIQNESV